MVYQERTKTKIMSEGKEILKTYEKDELKVYWKPNSCIHSTKCWKGLIQVFNPKNRPWVNLETATSKRIQKQIDECPSGALSYELNTDGKAKYDTEVKCLENGPLIIMGDVHVINSNGAEELKKKATAFCRCGASNNKPYCDGTHGKVGFIG
ncbi:Uncharacterized Fe-S cluster protein YjdI [Tenacibaculum sp. MAR_2009_124]|nr:Uncharacterized Fe-S cluster protein YjdI [Tenacibaculum sp. MAR_2009_124]